MDKSLTIVPFSCLFWVSKWRAFWSETTLNYWMMVERYPNLKKEVGDSIPGCEISSLPDRKLARWSTASCALALASRPSVLKIKNNKKQWRVYPRRIWFVAHLSRGDRNGDPKAWEGSGDGEKGGAAIEEARVTLCVFALSSSLHSVFFALSSKSCHCLRLLRFNSLLAFASSFSYVIHSLRLLPFLTRYSHRAAPAGIISFNCCILSHLTTNGSSYHWTYGQTGTTSSYLKWLHKHWIKWKFV